jgi:hypothetical protein
VSAVAAPLGAPTGPVQAWSLRVRRVGGFIQLAFATFWLIRGALTLGGDLGGVLAAALAAIALAVTVYGVRATAGRGPRPSGPEARRIERAVTIATILQLIASFALPWILIDAGYPDWVLPSIAFSIGPLLLWLDHRVDIPRYRPVGWALIVGPAVLGILLSGPALAATTGIAAGVLLLTAAAAGFHDLARTPPGHRDPAPTTTTTPSPLTPGTEQQ